MAPTKPATTKTSAKRTGQDALSAANDPRAGAAATAETERKGADARSPLDYKMVAWRAILHRVWVNNGERNVSLIAAGVAFYAFLSFVPLIAALVMTYGLVADPATVARHMQGIIELVPTDAAKLIRDQLVTLTLIATNKKGLGLLLALAVSIFGASRAASALITALNTIYGQRDGRGIIHGFLLSSALIIGAVLIAIAGVLSASMIGYAQDFLAGAHASVIGLAPALTWFVAGGLCCFAIAALYRFAPDRADAAWHWLSLGSIIATLLWLLATLGFGFYAKSFAGYDATYGSLSAVVVLLMWLYLSAYAVLIGALINAEVERQTAHDTTTGPERPIGHRGAVVADMSAALDAPSGHE